VVAEWLEGLCGDGAFCVQSRTTPLRRSMCATSTAAERGQVPEREAPGPSKKFWRVRPQGEPPRSRHARSSCEPIRDLRPWSGGGTDPPVIARTYAPIGTIGILKRSRYRVGGDTPFIGDSSEAIRHSHWLWGESSRCPETCEATSREKGCQV
jgi:hypothetical protein